MTTSKSETNQPLVDRLRLLDQSVE